MLGLLKGEVAAFTEGARAQVEGVVSTVMAALTAALGPSSERLWLVPWQDQHTMAKKKTKKSSQASAPMPAKELRAFVEQFPEPPLGLDHLDPYDRDLRTHWADFLDECIAKNHKRTAQSVYNTLKNQQMLLYMAWVAGLDIEDAYNKYYFAQDMERNRLVSLVRAELPWAAVEAGLNKVAEDGEFTMFKLSFEETE